MLKILDVNLENTHFFRLLPQKHLNLGEEKFDEIKYEQNDC